MRPIEESKIAVEKVLKKYGLKIEDTTERDRMMMLAGYDLALYVYEEESEVVKREHPFDGKICGNDWCRCMA